MKYIIGLLALLSPWPLWGQLTIQGAPDEVAEYVNSRERTMTLSGSMESVIEASEIKAVVGITDVAHSPRSVLERHEAHKKKVIDGLTAAGIERGQMKVQRFASLRKAHPEFGDKQVGDSARSQITVELDDREEYVTLLAVLDRIPDTALEDVIYDHEHLPLMHRTTLEGACKRVMGRKEVYEQSLDLELRPISITEGEGSQRPDTSKGSSFGQIRISVNVTVLFSVHPKGDCKSGDKEPTRPKSE
jgi:uncharacterized protein YggE